VYIHELTGSKIERHHGRGRLLPRERIDQVAVAEAVGAIARRIISGSSTCFTSTSVTFTPHGFVSSSMIF
jgi:hypothetical protein